MAVLFLFLLELGMEPNLAFSSSTDLGYACKTVFSWQGRDEYERRVLGLFPYFLKVGRTFVRKANGNRVNFTVEDLAQQAVLSLLQSGSRLSEAEKAERSDILLKVQGKARIIDYMRLEGRTSLAPLKTLVKRWRAIDEVLRLWQKHNASWLTLEHVDEIVEHRNYPLAMYFVAAAVKEIAIEELQSVLNEAEFSIVRNFSSLWWRSEKEDVLFLAMRSFDELQFENPLEPMQRADWPIKKADEQYRMEMSGGSGSRGVGSSFPSEDAPVVLELPLSKDPIRRAGVIGLSRTREEIEVNGEALTIRLWPELGMSDLVSATGAALRDRVILFLNFEFEYSQLEVGWLFDLSESAISLRLTRAKNHALKKWSSPDSPSGLPGL